MEEPTAMRPQPGGAYPDLSAELIRMAEADQAMRRKAAQDQVWDPGIDRDNTCRLKEIVTQIGWPTKPKVGGQGAFMAWLLAQHADRDVDFQRACLRLMQEVPEGEVEPRNIAYLNDRVRVHEGRPQLYGTQFQSDESGAPVPHPIEDPEHLDERRRAMGLEPFAEYQELMQSRPRPAARRSPDPGSER